MSALKFATLYTVDGVVFWRCLPCLRQSPQVLPKSVSNENIMSGWATNHNKQKHRAALYKEAAQA